jgi:glycosyltransferase involved in cell wall biosynthesis
MNLSGDAPRLIMEARCGLVLPAEDAEGLTGAILKLYNDRDLGKEMGLNGRSYVEQHLSLYLAAENYERLFAQTITDV